MPTLIIIRGNSGSGKSTIAHQARNELGDKVMLLQQDVLRRDILKVKDKAGNPAVGLIDQMARYGYGAGYDVIIEGILTKDRYGSMLKSLIELFDETHVYYLDIPFEETLRRHSTRHKKHDFGEAEMREWWCDKDYLGVVGEMTIDETATQEQIVALILRQAGY